MQKMYGCHWARKDSFPEGIVGKPLMAPYFVEAASVEDAYNKYKIHIEEDIARYNSDMKLEDYLLLVAEWWVFNFDEEVDPVESVEVKPAIRHLELDDEV